MIIATVNKQRFYEGDEQFISAIFPLPAISTVVHDEASQAVLGQTSQYNNRLFREDSFDPTTRIRRGRFYTQDGYSHLTWARERVSHFPYGEQTDSPPSSYFMECYRSWQPNGSRLPVGSPVIFLGDAVHKTAWRVLGAERLLNQEMLFTLKLADVLGALPELAEEKLPEEASGQVRQGLENIVDAATKYMPDHIIDVCREYARLLIVTWLSSIGIDATADDLGAAISTIPEKYVGIRSAASIIGRFHPRGKSAERERQAQVGLHLRRNFVEDGELSVALVGFLLREFGWSK